MEGIRDGRARDDCFLCGLLFPDRYRGDCPRCGHRMRYQPASLVSGDDLEGELVDLAASYEAAPAGQRREPLIRLLEWLHRYEPDSLDALDERTGLALDDLRRAWRVVSG